MKITSKGQVTIPQDIRERHSFYPHSEIQFKEEGDRVYIIKTDVPSVKEGPFDYVKGRATASLSTEDIMKLTRSDV